MGICWKTSLFGSVMVIQHVQQAKSKVSETLPTIVVGGRHFWLFVLAGGPPYKHIHTLYIMHILYVYIQLCTYLAGSLQCQKPACQQLCCQRPCLEPVYHSIWIVLFLPHRKVVAHKVSVLAFELVTSSNSNVQNILLSWWKRSTVVSRYTKPLLYQTSGYTKRCHLVTERFYLVTEPLIYQTSGYTERFSRAPMGSV